MIEEGLRAIKWNAGEKLLLFSDSPERAREVLAPLCIGENLEFADPSLSGIETLLFMGAPNRLVCSRSTFSWWAARLVTRAGGEVAFPKPSRGDAFTLRECRDWSWI